MIFIHTLGHTDEQLIPQPKINIVDLFYIAFQNVSMHVYLHICIYI